MLSDSTQIEAELWKIYSFYSLHADPTIPEQLKVPSFIRFAKDCQIISNKLKGASIELEIAKVARDKRSNSEKGDYNPSVSLSFADFLSLLGMLAEKVYPTCDPQVAIRRLLLENVLLLASRRVPLCLDHEVKFPEAVKVVRETYVRPLQHIFNYYLRLAESRRNQRGGAEVTKRNKERELAASGHSQLSAPISPQAVTNALREQQRQQRDLIHYKEYIQFCHDFTLRSTSLLTAIQVGEIYLNCVPIDRETKQMKGMNFDTFCTALLHMSVVAYRDCQESLPLQNKVKALLLFMWKAVNNREKTAEVARSRVRVVISHAGSLNMFGSGLFSDHFLHCWQAEGFPDYTAAIQPTVVDTGMDFLRKITKEPKTVVNPTAEADQPVQLELLPEKSASVPQVNNNDPLVVRGFQIAALLRRQPELAEYLYLEIQQQEQSQLQTLSPF